MESDGVNLRNFNKLILNYLRNLILLKASPEMDVSKMNFLGKEQIDAAKREIENIKLSLLVLLLEIFQKSLARFKESAIPQLPLELAIIEFSLECNKESQTQDFKAPSKSKEARALYESKQQPPDPRTEKFHKPQTEISQKTAAASIDQDNQQKEPAEKQKQRRQISLPKEKFDGSLEEVLEHWSQILEEMKPHNHSISAFLKNCTPCGIKDGNLYIKTKYDFYKDKLSEVNNRLTVQKVVGTIMNASVKVNFVTEKECQLIDFDKKNNSTDIRNPLHDAMQVFGGRIIK
jgi:DNA polymerase III gamma/tau subunit